MRITTTALLMMLCFCIHLKSIAQENLSLSTVHIDNLQFDSSAELGTACLNFSANNINGSYKAGAAEIEIQLFKIKPRSETDDLASIESKYSSWEWSYNSIDNNFTGRLVDNLGALYRENFTLCFEVTEKSKCPIEENGAIITVQVLEGTDFEDDNRLSIFTCSESLSER